MFDPQQHLIKLPRKVKDRQTGHYVTHYDEYLEVKWRLCWFRDRFPHGSIITEEICVDLDRGYARYRTTVGDGEGGIATGTGTETAAGFADYVEKAETRSIGRALAALGIGTQFVGEELSEAAHVCDAPVQASDGMPSTPDEPHPPTDEIDRLCAIAESCQEPKDLFGRRLREIMGLSGETRITKKLLREAMTMTHFTVALAYYEQMLKRQVEEDVPDGTASPETATPEPAQPPTQEDPPTGPFGSSSAPATADAEGPTAVGGPGQPANPAAVYATREEIAALKKLAAQVGAEAAEDLQDVLDHAPKGLLPDLYRRIEARLQARLHGKPTAAVA
jgi:hypothetical protein